MESLEFTGTGKEYFKIWIVNVLLTIVTLGIYLPWAKVRNRRYFYANITLDDRNFEYHATGKQLLLGYIIGVVLFIIYTFVTQIAPQVALVFMLLLMIVAPWLIWKSLMFNMKMTSFSNVRFSFKGTLGKAYKIFLGYPLLGMLVVAVVVAASVFGAEYFDKLGSIKGMMPEASAVILAVALSIGFMLGYIYFYAFIKKKSTEYYVSNVQYGQGKFETTIETKKFFKIMLKAAALSAVISLVFVMIGFFGGAPMPGNAELALAISYITMLIYMTMVMAYVKSRERAYVYENTRLDGKIAFESTLRAREFAWVMVSNMFLIFITLGFAFPWAKVRVARVMLENTLVDTSSGIDAYLSQQQEYVSSIGDQIGDAFDVDVGIGF